ncbi:radical SAM family heme chaperone HemW [Thalassovita sp.]|uniref:radical SAM family heme chaperone HemW n=1 Tax=Thalassovita sp. TaxID=1979401 RepID=UPI002881530D|nr:radical SAM family heme chaperone HemW [Thalassovita sp.]MDF1802194.1 radical SAM family heme chaperone HemW [Thalassovita sp.]
MTEDWQNGGFGVYIHWPFCQAKCPYCDFNSHVSREIDQSRWLRAYISEIDRYAEQVPGRALTSVFFGGGTPSLMDPDIVHGVLTHLRRHWAFSNSIEITLEANPGSVDAGRFAGYAQAGVNRISMGIQALNNQDLRLLGRIHTVEEARKAFDVARNQFSRVSFDLIYARQNQTLDAWKSELREALAMAIDHLSLYQLTIEQGTAFGDRYNRGKLRGLPEDDLAADMYEVTQDLCAEAGLSAYEVSNYAKPGSESLHNSVYWRYGDYLGVGPGAHGRLTLNDQRYGAEAFSNPAKWLDMAAAGQTEKHREQISLADQANEFLMMGLRLSEGVSRSRFEKIASKPLNQERLTYLKDIGMVSLAGDNVSVTRNGRMVLNTILRELLVD